MRTRAAALTIVCILVLGVPIGEGEMAAPTAKPGWLGFAFVYHPPSADSRAAGWMHVHHVAAGGPADRRGLRPQDVILSIDGQTLRFHHDIDLLTHLARIRPGQVVKIAAMRRQRRRELAITAIEMSDVQHETWLENMRRAARKQERRSNSTSQPRS